ncbi:hypothetical protein MTO96_003981 [Rhipicephalus appendiculatus]
MYSSAALLLLALAAAQFCLFSASARSFWKHHKHHHETLDAFQILSVNGSSVALRDVNQDPMFKCLTATSIDFDRDVPSATYQWSLNAGDNAPRKNVTLHYTKGPSIDTATLVVDSGCLHFVREQTPLIPDVIRYLYLDPSGTCGIMELRYFGYQCTLWARITKENIVPEECFKKHLTLCGKGVSLYDKDTCGHI